MTSCKKYNMQVREFFGKKRRQLFVLRELTKKEKKHMNSETRLGQLWVLADPLLHMALFSFLATNWFKHNLENFPMYVLTGYCIFHFYSHATTGAITALVSNKSFLIRTNWKKKIFVEQRIFSALHEFLYCCVAYIVFLFIFQIKPGWKCLFFVPDMLLMLLLVFGIGEILAVTYVFFADIRYFYDNFMTLLLFSSGLFYSVDILPDEAKLILEWNPVYICIEIARNSVMYNRYTGIWTWSRLAAWALAMFLLGRYIFNKKENAVMQKL